MTRHCFQAGDREDIGALQGTEASEAAHGSAWASEGLNNYLVCLVEQAQEKESEDTVILGIVAVETSTGTIKYDEFRCTSLPFRVSVGPFQEIVAWGKVRIIVPSASVSWMMHCHLEWWTPL